MNQDRGHLSTEHLNERSAALDEVSVEEAFEIMSAEDATIWEAVAAAKSEICAAVRLVTDAFERGGRLIYVGAGTSGRLGVLDSAECPPTFMTDRSMVQGIIAGGFEALRRSIEGAEDNDAAGAAAIDAKEVGEDDVVMGIATGGTTPYVRAAIRRARERRAKTVFFACVPKDQVADEADVSIRVVTGPEVIAGSTRLKAGTATKLVLNTITTLSMVQMGKVYGNLMVDLNSKACAKLQDRAVRIVSEATGVDRTTAEDLLRRSDGEVKTAIVMELAGLNATDARSRIESCGGRIRAAIGKAEDPG